MMTQKWLNLTEWCSAIDTMYSPMQIAEIIGSRSENIEITAAPIRTADNNAIRIWKWCDTYAECIGYLREDSTGFSSICPELHGGDDELYREWKKETRRS